MLFIYVRLYITRLAIKPTNKGLIFSEEVGLSIDSNSNRSSYMLDEEGKSTDEPEERGSPAYYTVVE